MTMAVDMVTAYAFSVLGLHRLEANVMPRNKASLRVLEKNGFLNEGLSKYYLNINEVWEDHIHMVKLNESMHRDKAGWAASIQKKRCLNPLEKRGKQESTKKLKKIKKVLDGVENL